MSKARKNIQQWFFGVKLIFDSIKAEHKQSNHRYTFIALFAFEIALLSPFPDDSMASKEGLEFHQGMCLPFVVHTQIDCL